MSRPVCELGYVVVGLLAAFALSGCRDRATKRAQGTPGSASTAGASSAKLAARGAVSSAPLPSAPSSSAAPLPVDDTPLPVRLRRVMKGEIALGSMVDAARGFVIRDSEGTLRACGPAVPVFLDAIARTLRFQGGGPPRCVPRGELDVCLFEVREPISRGPNFGLGFERSQRGPFLVAALWSDGVGPKQVERAVLKETVGCPSPDADARLVSNGGAPQPSTPDAGTNGPNVDKALMRRFANGKDSFEPLVDRERGIRVVTCVSGETEPPVTRRSAHLCGAKAVKALENERRRLRDCITMNEVFECRSEPRHAEPTATATTCRLGIAGEYETISEYRFRATEKGPMLDAVLHLSSAYPELDEAPCAARLLTKQLGKTCPHEAP